jgi:hypothetical protein
MKLTFAFLLFAAAGALLYPAPRALAMQSPAMTGVNAQSQSNNAASSHDRHHRRHTTSASKRHHHHHKSSAKR